jgi:transposase
VAQLIRDRLGVTSHPNDLREWLSGRGYSPQKPKRKARQQNPEQVHEFLTATYPAVQEESPRTTPTSP